MNRDEKRDQKAVAKAERAVAKLEAKAERVLEKAQARSAVPQLKERVIHTRVPAALDEELKRRADQLRVPVSNLIRIILEDAVAGPLDLRRLPAPKNDAPPQVIGYQPFLATMPTSCSRCGTALAAGANAFVGLTDPPGPRWIACSTCVTASSADGPR